MDGSGQQRRGGGLPISEQIMKTAALLLRAFICDEIGSIAESVAELAREQVSQAPYIQLLVEVLKHKAQEMCKDEELQRLITALDGVCTAAAFFPVAGQIYSNGIAWGLVAVLFRLASKLVLKALNNNMPQQIELIMDWTLHFLQVRLLAWIQEQGGWDGLLAKHGDTLKWMAVAMAIGTGLLALLGLRRI